MSPSTQDCTAVLDWGWPCPGVPPSEGATQGAQTLCDQLAALVLAALEAQLGPCESLCSDLAAHLQAELDASLAVQEQLAEALLQTAIDWHTRAGQETPTVILRLLGASFQPGPPSQGAVPSLGDDGSGGPGVSSVVGATVAGGGGQGCPSLACTTEQLRELAVLLAPLVAAILTGSTGAAGAILLPPPVTGSESGSAAPPAPPPPNPYAAPGVTGLLSLSQLAAILPWQDPADSPATTPGT